MSESAKVPMPEAERHSESCSGCRQCDPRSSKPENMDIGLHRAEVCVVESLEAPTLRERPMTCPNCGHAVSTWRPTCFGCGRRVL